MSLMGKKAVLLVLAAVLIEVTLCQASFWITWGKKGEDLMQRMEVICEDVSLGEMDAAAGEFPGTTAGEEAEIYSPRLWPLVYLSMCLPAPAPCTSASSLVIDLRCRHRRVSKAYPLQAKLHPLMKRAFYTL